MKNKVIAEKELPARPPTILTLLAYLYLDRFSYAPWFDGVVWVLIATAWIVWVVRMFGQEQTSVFDPQEAKWTGRFRR